MKVILGAHIGTDLLQLNATARLRASSHLCLALNLGMAQGWQA